MATNKTLAERIVDSYHTGKSDPTELAALAAVDDGDTLAAGVPVANIVSLEEDNTVNATFDSAEVKLIVDAHAAAINLLIAALEEFKIAATS